MNAIVMEENGIAIGRARRDIQRLADVRTTCRTAAAVGKGGFGFRTRSHKQKVSEIVDRKEELVNRKT
jgi:hypothetical protein